MDKFSQDIDRLVELLTEVQPSGQTLTGQIDRGIDLFRRQLSKQIQALIVVGEIKPEQTVADLLKALDSETFLGAPYHETGRKEQAG